jgi:hypothetical protein
VMTTRFIDRRKQGAPSWEHASIVRKTGLPFADPWDPPVN